MKRLLALIACLLAVPAWAASPGLVSLFTSSGTGATFVVTCGTHYSAGPPITIQYNGYAPTQSIGSILPTTLNGHSVTAAYELIVNGTQSIFEFSFSDGSNPGQSYFTTLVINGDTYLSTNASYSYSGGSAIWTWTPGMHGIPTSGTVSMMVG